MQHIQIRQAHRSYFVWYMLSNFLKNDIIRYCEVLIINDTASSDVVTFLGTELYDLTLRYVWMS